MWPSALTGVLSYRNREHICTIEPLRRAARTTRLLLRNLGGHPPLAVDQSSNAQTALLTRSFALYLGSGSYYPLATVDALLRSFFGGPPSRVKHTRLGGR